MCDILKKITENRYYFSNHIGILLIIFLISIFFVYNSFSISQNAENSLTNILFEDFFPLITVEYESDSTIVLKGDENSLLILNGTLAPLWNAIDIVKNNGYKLIEITESGMGSQGNPTRFYAILEKEKIEEKIHSLDKQTQSAQDRMNQTYQDIDQTKVTLNSSHLMKSNIGNTNSKNTEIKNVTYNKYKNEIMGIKLQYPSDWYLTNEDNKVNSSCMENICNLFLYRNLKSNNTSNIDTYNNNSVGLVISSGSVNSQGFKEKCKCDSLLEFVKFFYTNLFENNDNVLFLNDNEITISGNVSAWQLEFDITNPNNNDFQKKGKTLTILTINNNVFYILVYATDENVFNKYLSEVKKIIQSIEFVVPKNDPQSLSKDNLPSFMTINKTKEDKKKQPSFMITENTTESNILQNEKTSISAKEPNEGLTREELVNETIALKNQPIKETIIGRQEKQEQFGGATTLEEQLKLAQEKLNQLGLGSFPDNDSQSLDKQAQSAQEKLNQTHQVKDSENWIIGESDKLSFKYPSHWNVNVSDSRFDNYELIFTDKVTNASIQVSDEAIKPIDKIYMHNGAEGYVDMYMKYNLPLSSDSSRIDTYHKGKVSIAGLPAYSELYLDQGNAILISLAFPEGNDRHYTVVSKSPSSKYDQLEPIMLEIIKSITQKT
jgi:hypothetical protein